MKPKSTRKGTPQKRTKQPAEVSVLPDALVTAAAVFVSIFSEPDPKKAEMLLKDNSALENINELVVETILAQT